MKKSVVILLHLGYWLLYGFLFTFLFFISRTTTQAAFDDWDDWLVILSVAAFTGFGSFYAFYGWLVPRYLSMRHVGKFIGWGLVVSVAVASVVTGLVFLAVTGLVSVAVNNFTPVVPSVEDLVAFLGWFSLLAVVNGLLATIIRGFITWYADIHVKETLINRTLRTELAPFRDNDARNGKPEPVSVYKN